MELQPQLTNEQLETYIVGLLEEIGDVFHWETQEDKRDHDAFIEKYSIVLLSLITEENNKIAKKLRQIDDSGMVNGTIDRSMILELASELEIG